MGGGKLEKISASKTWMVLPSRATDEVAQRLILAHNPKQQSKEFKSYIEALHELFKVVTNQPDQFGSDCSLHGSNDDLSLNSTEVSLHDSRVLFTETDVTLPSCLDGSFGFQEIDKDRELQCAGQFPDLHVSSSLVLVKVYQEMITIYKQLKAERQSQQQWERKLHEREKRLKQQEEAFERIAGLEGMVHSHILAAEKKHQKELSRLQDVTRERSKENKRLKSSFDTIKEQNDNMRKQLDTLNEQNKKLESQSKRLQGRFENLQRKLEHCTRACQKGSVNGKECIKPHIKEKTSLSGKPSNKGSSSPIQLKLLTLLLEWVLDGQMLSSVEGNEVRGIGQCLPPEFLLSEKCVKVLPLLADQLHHTPLLEPNLLLNLLRLIYSALRHLDKSMQHVSLSATLRRIGEEVSRPAAQLTLFQSKDPDLPMSCSEATAPFRSCPLSQSPCPHTRILSNLIILRTLTQADVLVQAFDRLHADLKCEESRRLFIQYGGVCALLSMLRSGRVGLHRPIDILMQLAEQSRYLNPFLEACSCEEFFRTVSQLLKNPCLELPSLEKLSILLQKLSSIRKNLCLFERSSIHLQIQDLHHKTDRTHTFLRLNLKAILHNLK